MENNSSVLVTDMVESWLASILTFVAIPMLFIWTYNKFTWTIDFWHKLIVLDFFS